MATLLNTIGREFIGVKTDADVYTATITAANTLLDADLCTIALAHDDPAVLRSHASTPNETGPADFPIPASLPGTVYTRGEPCLIENLTDIRGTAATQPTGGNHQSVGDSTYRSLVIVPIADIGVLLCAATEPAAFAETDRDNLCELADFTAEALQQTDSTEATDPERLEEIASTLSHDLQTPLQVVKGRLELAAATVNSEHLTEAEAALDRIETIINDLAMLAHTNERIGKQDRVEFAQLVNTAWTTVGTPAATLELDEGSAEIIADESTVCQLLENLFSNAIEHGGSDVTIRVGMLESGFYVEDDGPGIPPERRDRVFEWRVSAATGHPGLGLAIVDRIATAHGWDITLADSERGGARFEITGVDFPPITD